MDRTLLSQFIQLFQVSSRTEEGGGGDMPSDHN